MGGSLLHPFAFFGNGAGVIEGGGGGPSSCTVTPRCERMVTDSGAALGCFPGGVLVADPAERADSAECCLLG